MEVVAKRPSKECPEFRRNNCVPSKSAEKVPISEWQVQRRKRRSTSVSIGIVAKNDDQVKKTPAFSPSTLFSNPVPRSIFITYANPYMVLAGLDDDACQFPRYEQKQPEHFVRIAGPQAAPDISPSSPTTEITVQSRGSPVSPISPISPIFPISPISPISPITSITSISSLSSISEPKPAIISKITKHHPTVNPPIKLPGAPLVWSSTQTLAKDTKKNESRKKQESSPAPVRFFPMVDDDLDMAWIFKSRRRKNSCRPQTRKRANVPTRDNADTFRNASAQSKMAQSAKPKTQEPLWRQCKENEAEETEKARRDWRHLKRGG